MKRNTEIKVKVVECNSKTNLVVLQTNSKTYSFTDKEFCEFILTAFPAKVTIKKESIYTQVAQDLLLHLNKTGGRSFPVSEKNTAQIIARLSEGEDPKLIARVIELKSWEWKDDFKMKRYLRPETLFNPTKFQGYKQEVLDIQNNPKGFKNYVATKDHEKRTSGNSGYDPLDSMP